MCFYSVLRQNLSVYNMKYFPLAEMFFKTHDLAPPTIQNLEIKDACCLSHLFSKKKKLGNEVWRP